MNGKVARIACIVGLLGGIHGCSEDSTKPVQSVSKPAPSAAIPPEPKSIRLTCIKGTFINPITYKRELTKQQPPASVVHYDQDPHASFECGNSGLARLVNPENGKLEELPCELPNIFGQSVGVECPRQKGVIEFNPVEQAPALIVSYDFTCRDQEPQIICP